MSGIIVAKENIIFKLKWVPLIFWVHYSHICSPTCSFIVNFLLEIEFYRKSLKAFKEKNQFCCCYFRVLCLLPSNFSFSFCFFFPFLFLALFYGVQGHTFWAFFLAKPTCSKSSQTLCSLFPFLIENPS